MRLVLVAVFSVLILGVSPAKAEPQNCERQGPEEPVIYHTDFRWNQTFGEMSALYEEFYHSPKRLSERAYFHPGLGQYVFDYSEGDSAGIIEIPEHFIESLTRHIEAALERRYASFIFFPDMGHQHFFIPAQFYKEKIANVRDWVMIYQRLLDEPSVKLLYHTAEQLMMRGGDGSPDLLQDAYLQWRYFTRNLIGSRVGDRGVEPWFAWGEKFNTLRELDGYEFFNPGVYFSANEKGCFPFQHEGKTFYFDMTLKYLPMPPREDGDWGGW